MYNYNIINLLYLFISIEQSRKIIVINRCHCTIVFNLKCFIISLQIIVDSRVRYLFILHIDLYELISYTFINEMIHKSTNLYTRYNRYRYRHIKQQVQLIIL